MQSSRLSNTSNSSSTKGLSADGTAKVCDARPQLEVSGDTNGVTVKTTSGQNVFSNSIVFGQDSEASIATLKYTVKFDM